MPRSHKYIKKYRSKKGKWVYIYPGDLAANKAPNTHETSVDDLKSWAEVNPSDHRYRMPNGYTPGEYGPRSKGPKISSKSTNKHNPYQHYEKYTRNTNSLFSSTTRSTNRVGGGWSPESVYVTEVHKTGKIERAYNRGKRKASKLIRSAKKTSAKKISRGKRALSKLLAPQTEVKHTTRLE